MPGTKDETPAATTLTDDGGEITMATTPPTEPTAPTPPAMGERWALLLTPLATAFGLEIAALNGKLAEHVGEPKDESLELFSYVKDEALTGMANPKAPKALVAKAIADLRTALAPAPEPEAPVADPSVGTDFTTLLPSLPDDQSFLSALVDIDPLKVDEMVAVAGVRGMLAFDLGLDGIPKRVMQEVEAYAVTQGDQCPPIFYEVRRMLRRRAHADVLDAIKLPGGGKVGSDGIMDAEHQKQLVARMRPLVSGMHQFHTMVNGWMEAYAQASGNPLLLQQAIGQIFMGGKMGAMGMNPAVMAAMQEQPDIQPIIDAALAFNTEANRAFAGVYAHTAKGMAADYLMYTGLLQRPELPAAMGAANHRDMMKSKLKATIPPMYRQIEQQLSKYMLAMFRLGKVGPVDEDQSLGLIVALYRTGKLMNWDEVLRGKYSDSDESPSGDAFARPKGRGGPRAY